MRKAFEFKKKSIAESRKNKQHILELSKKKD